ncbi:MAG TPA: hypothetical protein VHH73_00040, partial [Verrucomicrobiae bacterium]|nr:hypothetical protein [Verrucomicrobiae bacterium]
MKLTPKLLTLLSASLLSTAASAQVELTIVGSTAFRSVVFDRVASLFDPASIKVVTNLANSTTAGNERTYQGTVATAVPALGNQPVTIRLSFSGSASGMLQVKNQTQVETADFPTGTATNAAVNRVADLSLSDVFPGAASPPIPDSAFDRAILGVVPFVFAKNNGLAGVSNITRDQAVLLMTASGANGMPASYLGGTGAGEVYLIGRDSGSGTRISTEKDIGFSGTPLLWATNSAGQFVTTNGFSSGSAVAGILKSIPNTIGYLGLADFVSITNQATALSYNGVPFSPANVASGAYAIWGYEHLVSRV